MDRYLDAAGPNASKTVNASGGEQSEVKFRFDLLDPGAMFALGAVLDHGAKYGVDNWRLIPIEDHTNHAIMHIMAYQAGDRQEDHLGHAFCRIMFALGVELQGGVGQGERAQKAAAEFAHRTGDKYLNQATYDRVTGRHPHSPPSVHSRLLEESGGLRCNLCNYPQRGKLGAPCVNQEQGCGGVITNE